MKTYQARGTNSALTVDGDTTGDVTVASGTDFMLGAQVVLSNNLGDTLVCIIVKKNGNILSLWPVGSKSYCKADTSLFKIADSSTLYQDAQVITLNHVENSP